MMAKSKLVTGVAALAAGCTIFSSHNRTAQTPTLPELPEKTGKGLEALRGIYNPNDWGIFNAEVSRNLKHAEGQQPKPDGVTYELLREYFPAFKVGKDGTLILGKDHSPIPLTDLELARHNLRLCMGQTERNFYLTDPNSDQARVRKISSQLVHKIFESAVNKVGK